MHVNFGEPIFLDDVLKKNNAPKHIALHENLPDTVKASIDDVAYDILEHINKAVVINPVSLISLVLLNAPTHSLAERDVLLRLEQFRNLLNQHRYDERMQITQLSNHEIIQYAVKLKQVEFVEHDNERWVKVSDKQEALLKYFSNNILHTFILPASIAFVLKSQLEHADPILVITQQELVAKVVDQYADIQKMFFLKWQVTEIPAEIDQILEYFSDEKVIRMDENQQIHITQADEYLRLLSAFAHLYEVNLEKPSAS